MISNQRAFQSKQSKQKNAQTDGWMQAHTGVTFNAHSPCSSLASASPGQSDPGV